MFKKICKNCGKQFETELHFATRCNTTCEPIKVKIDGRFGSYPLKCLRCGHTWQAFKPRPVQCPGCKSPSWDTPSSRSNLIPQERTLTDLEGVLLFQEIKRLELRINKLESLLTEQSKAQNPQTRLLEKDQDQNLLEGVDRGIDEGINTITPGDIPEEEVIPSPEEDIPGMEEALKGSIPQVEGQQEDIPSLDLPEGDIQEEEDPTLVEQRKLLEEAFQEGIDSKSG